MDNEQFMKLIGDSVKTMRRTELDNSPQLLLGELILKLEAVQDKGVDVYFDFTSSSPTELDSYRGYYDELALNFDGDVPHPNVSKLLEELKGAIGKTYTGYKGGEFTMSKNTPVWVSNYGNADNTVIVDVREVDTGVDKLVYLVTQQRDD